MGEIPQKIVWADSNNFWVSRFADLDSDGKQEIIGRIDDTFSIYENIGDNQYSLSFSFENLTTGSNSTGVPHTEIGDFDNDSQMEILMADYDGDIYIYESTGNDAYQFTWHERLPLIDAINFISCGDYDGDGILEFAAGCHSSSDLDLEHEYDGRYWIFRIYDSSGDNKYSAVWEQSFFGFAEPADFACSISSGDVDGDGRSELLVNVFPDFYLIDYNLTTLKYETVGYFYPSRSQANLIIDIDADGKNEFLINTGSETVILQDKYSSTFSGPPAPAGFQAFPLNETKVCLQWLPVQDANYYQIYRGKSTDQVSLLTTVTELSYTDSTVVANEFFWYAISAVDLSLDTKESRKTAAISVQPGTQPFCNSAQFILPNQVRIQFSETMDNSIKNISAYQFSGNLGQPISTVISKTGKEALLTMGKNVIPAGRYNLEIKNVRDIDRTPIDTTRNIIEFEVSEQPTAFYLFNAVLKNESTIILCFNLPVDSASASQKINYSFSPILEIDHVCISEDNKNQVEILIKKEKAISGQYIITAKNIFSDSGIPISTGQGNQTSLTITNIKPLKIYAYPNPCRVTEGHQSITFANLFHEQTVKIITLSGTIIRTIKNPNNEGNLFWDLKNKKGELVGSGIIFIQFLMVVIICWANWQLLNDRLFYFF